MVSAGLLDWPTVMHQHTDAIDQQRPQAPPPPGDTIPQVTGGQRHDELVEAALAAAQQLDRDIADVPLTAVAAAAGISRSTLLRRLGGTRAALDAAVRQAGIDPGGRAPVRERAITAAAELIAERGLGSVTLEAVADAAQCSLPSLHAIFKGRDGLLAGVFDRYGPMLDLRQLAADPPADLHDTVRAISRALVTVLDQEPRVLPALFADLLGRPNGPASQLVRTAIPQMLGPVETLLLPHVRAGRLRPIPLPLLLQLLLGPIATHLLLRPTLAQVMRDTLPSKDDVCDLFTDAFLRAAAIGN